jgi:hypothetical protein
MRDEELSQANIAACHVSALRSCFPAEGNVEQVESCSSGKKQVSVFSYSEHRVFVSWLPILLYCPVRELWLGAVNKKTNTTLVSSTRAVLEVRVPTVHSCGMLYIFCFVWLFVFLVFLIVFVKYRVIQI